MLTEHADLTNSWRYLKMKIELAHHHHLFDIDSRNVVRNPVIEELMPGLLYIAMVSLLDEFVDEWLAQSQVRPTSDKLFAKLKLLDQNQATQVYAELDKMRDRRNTLAHEFNSIASWPELDDAFALAQKELQRVGLLGPVLEYEAFAERSAGKFNPGKPGVMCEFDHSFGLKVDGKVAMAYQWTTSLMGDNA